MIDFLVENQKEVVSTLILVTALLILKFILTQTIRKVGQLRNFNKARTRLVNRFVTYGLMIIAVVIAVFIWGINLREIGLIFSSLFAVLGVAMFASWSILSNVTAGIILFLNFPFKVGDRIRILDKDMEYDGTFLIEDIRAYHLHLRQENGELMTYPNNLVLQKAVVLVNPDTFTSSQAI